MCWLDLHMHTNISSDGDYTPEQLMGLCKEANVKVAAIADHNSVKGITEGLHCAKLYNIELIPAVELDCTIEGVNLHLLGYGINVPNPDIDRIELDILEKGQAAASEQMKLVKDLGIYFEEGAVMQMAFHGMVTGEMIAEAALNDERNRNSGIMAPYYEGGSRSDNPYVNFYWDFCSMGKPAYIPIEYISLEKAISIIRESNGIPVLAHPGNNIGKDEELLSKIVACGIDGIEVYSSYHDLETIGFYQKQAEKYNLIATLGSDFHGRTKPAIQLGTMDCHGVQTKIYDSLKQRL